MDAYLLGGGRLGLTVIASLCGKDLNKNNDFMCVGRPREWWHPRCICTANPACG
jgi:hypothetical protein